MTRRAIDVVALLTASQDLHSDRERHQVSFFAVDQAGVVEAVFAQLSARDGMFNLGPDRAPVSKERSAPLRDKFGLVLHVLATAGNGERGKTESQKARGTDSGRQLNPPPPRPTPAGSFPKSCAIPPPRTSGR